MSEKETPAGVAKFRSVKPETSAVVIKQPVTYTLKFRLRDIEQPFSYIVEEDDWERVSGLFGESDRGPIPYFVNFTNASSGMSVHVCARFVMLFQALCDAGQPQRPPAVSDDEWRVTFHVNGLTKPLDYVGMDRYDIADLNFHLTLYDPDVEEFIAFVDGDGELNAVRGDCVMLVECPDFLPADKMPQEQLPGTTEQ